MGSNLFDTGGSIPSYSPLWSESQNLYFTRFCPLLIGRIPPSDWSRVVSIVSIVSIVSLVSLIPNSARAICFHFTQLHLLFSFCFLLSRTAAVGILLLHVFFLLKKLVVSSRPRVWFIKFYQVIPTFKFPLFIFLCIFMSCVFSSALFFLENVITVGLLFIGT